MNHVSLFTGIGGLDLAAEAAGFESVLQVEREPYALRILERHWPNVPRITDVREVTSESVRGDVTVISGGFPCQPFSAAGKRRGSDDDRYLWPELLRIVEELRPTWVVGENVSGLLSIDDGMEIDRLVASLEVANYEPWVLHYPAAGVGAYHKRDRVFIVGHAIGNGMLHKGHGRNEMDRRFLREAGRVKGANSAQSSSKDVANPAQLMRDGSGGTRRRRDEHTDGGQDVADSESIRGRGLSRQKWELQEIRAESNSPNRGRPTKSRMGGVAHGLPDWVDGEPDGIPRVATGVANRAARLKALGNAVVPAQAYPIFAAIAEAENA